jgi:hypothetical protein
MFNNILKRIQEAQTASAWQRSPLGQALTAHVNKYFTEYPPFADMDAEDKQKLLTDSYQWVNEVLQSENPVMKLREMLASSVAAFTELSVLCLTEEEKRDQFFADCPYISGQLHREIEKAVPHVEFLREAKWEFPDLSGEELVALCNARSGRSLFYVNGLNQVRVELKDCDKQKDWFRPFLRAEMILREHLYREKIGPPSLLSDKSDGLKYSTFFNLVLNGAHNPYYEWEKQWAHAPVT